MNSNLEVQVESNDPVFGPCLQMVCADGFLHPLSEMIGDAGTGISRTKALPGYPIHGLDHDSYSFSSFQRMDFGNLSIFIEFLFFYFYLSLSEAYKACLASDKC